MVGTTDPSHAAAIRALGAQPRVAARSAAELDTVKASFDKQWAKVPAGIAGWGVDVVSNSVVIYVVGADAEARVFAEAARAGHDGVRVEQVTELYRPYWTSSAVRR